jgi:hypothetical protein
MTQNTADTKGREVNLPETCIPDLNISFDVNRDWPCKRAQFVSHLHTLAADIERTEARLSRTRNMRTARNLAAWITDADARLARLVPFAGEKPCTCRASGLYG